MDITDAVLNLKWFECGAQVWDTQHKLDMDLLQ